MNIFISWSKESSHRVALGLRKLLTEILEGVDPWVSSEDIELGSRWNHVLSVELETSSFGIVCLVPENCQSPWIHFEAGAIAKSVEEGRLIPIVHNMSLTEIPGPLRQFQAVQCDQAGITRLVREVNAKTAQPKTARELELAIQKVWSSFASTIDNDLEIPVERTQLGARTSDIAINMGYLGSWKNEQIIINNEGDGVAREIQVFADEKPIHETPYVLGSQDFVSRLRPGEEFGVKIALSMSSPERTDIMVRWIDESGESRQVERMVTLL